LNEKPLTGITIPKELIATPTIYMTFNEIVETITVKEFSEIIEFKNILGNDKRRTEKRFCLRDTELSYELVIRIIDYFS
jgi:hypothetical protein